MLHHFHSKLDTTASSTTYKGWGLLHLAEENKVDSAVVQDFNSIEFNLNKRNKTSQLTTTLLSL